MLSPPARPEREADLAGLRYMIRENYEPRASVNVMEILKRASGGEGPPEFFSSHPTPDNRKEYLTEELQEEYQGRISYGRTDADEFQKIVSRALGPPPADANMAAERQ